MNPFQEVFVYLTQALSSLLLVVLMLRGVLTAVRADFYNPISQFVVRCTNPLILPLRKLLPITGRIDLAAVVLALAVQMTGFALIMFLSGYAPPNLLTLLVWSSIGLIWLVVSFLFVAIIAMIVLSWVAPGSGHPAVYLVYQIVEPVMAPFRAIIPPIGGIDISAIFVIIAIRAVKTFIASLALSAGVPGKLIIGL